MIEILGVTYITDKEASKRYGYSIHWFQRARYQKSSPPYVKLDGKGRVYYPLTQIDEWFRERLKLIS
jgi:predicted DNA-binding transcriptional regulator AlpA